MTKSINYFELPIFTLNKSTKTFRSGIFPNVRMALALAISIVADLFDYTMAPLFGMPVIGDVFDLIITWMLYSITKSKVSLVINLAEFIPFIGDFLPVYTVSTIIWILRQSGYDNLLIAKGILRFLSSTDNLKQKIS